MHTFENSSELSKNTNNLDCSTNTHKYGAEKIAGTPFTLVETEEGFFLTLGKYRLTEPTSDKDRVYDASQMNWDRVLQVICVLVEELTGKTIEQ